MGLGSVSDLAFLLQDAGDPVVFGECRTFGLLDESNVVESTDGLQLQTQATTVAIATGSLGPALRINSRITVGSAPGVLYAVRDISLEGDGATQRLTLARA